MLTYDLISKCRYLWSYTSKFAVLTLCCINILVLILVGFLATHVTDVDPRFCRYLLAVIAIGALLGSVVSFVATSALLHPMSLTVEPLDNDSATKQLPDLPVNDINAAGRLMSGTTQMIAQLDSLVRFFENYDAVTGLLNRKAFQAELAAGLLSLPLSQNLAVFVIDLDDFTSFNTSESHDVGDRLLKEVARRLAVFLDKSGSLARLGNDEFAFFSLQEKNLKDDFSTAKAALDLLNQPYDHIATQPYHVTASIGMAIAPADSQDAYQLITNAYAALEQAKRIECNRYQLYHADIAIQLRKQVRMINDLRTALSKEQLFLLYQPRVDCRSGQIVSVESLVRWRHPELGVLSPADFIPLAERTGEILAIGEWVLRTACQQNKAWQQAGLPPISVSVNLSIRQIEHPAFVNLIQSVLRETGLPTAHLELEVTESLLMNQDNHSVSTLTALHQLGVTLALDDFGTGYSALSYLRKLPFDLLKIDRTFTQDLMHSLETAKVTQAIAALAQGLGMKMVAEGVETATQLESIKRYGCYEIQGYYFSQPIYPDQLACLLAKPSLFSLSKAYSDRSPLERTAGLKKLITNP